MSGARHHGPSGDHTAARAPEGEPLHDARHRPEQTTLYRLVQRHASEFIAHTEAASPSCGARRMSQTAAHLVDHVIPLVPVRQWVLSLPIPLRLLLAAQPGSAANLNIHPHCLVLGGVYRSHADGVPEFIEAAAPTEEALHALLQTVIARLMKLLARRGVLVEDDGQSYLAESDTDGEEARTLRPLQAGAVTYRIAFGPRAGRRVLTLRGAMPREAAARQPLCADIDGFSLHAAVRIEAHDRRRLERLCRYIARPALSDERIQVNATGQVELRLKKGRLKFLSPDARWIIMR